jgi:hypothetical protein
MTIIMYDNHKDLNSLDIEEINSAAICNPVSNADDVIFRLPLSYDDICTAFTRCNLLPKTEDTIVASEIDRKITSQSFLALSYTYFGVKHHDKHITQNGLRQYGRSLGVLNNALTKDDAARSLDVLEAIMVMALIEVCSSLSLYKSTNLTSSSFLSQIEKMAGSGILAGWSDCLISAVQSQ